jgi:hypothetical protein
MKDEKAVPSHRNDSNGPGGLKTSKILSLREAADTTKRASALPVIEPYPNGKLI